MRFIVDFGRGDRAVNEPTPSPKAEADNEVSVKVTHERNWQMPWQLVTATKYTGALLIIGLFGYMLWVTVQLFADVTIPLAIALLFTALLWPAVEWLQAKGVWRSLAAALMMLLFFGVIGALFTLVGAQLATQTPEIIQQTQRGIALLPQWLENLSLPWIGHIDTSLITAKLQEMSGAILSGAAQSLSAVGSTVSHFAAGMVLAMFTTFFMLYDGRKFVHAAVNWLRPGVRAQLLNAGAFGWKSLVSYVRAIVIVAAVDGLFVGIGAAILGSNFYLSIGLLTFLLAFIPIIGAILAGVVAVLVVLVTLGLPKAIIMLVIYLVVNQLEGNVLHPFLLGKSVDLHPLLVLVGIAVGLTANGIVGALLIVPFMAFTFAFLKKLQATSPEGQLLVSPQAPPVKR